MINRYFANASSGWIGAPHYVICTCRVHPRKYLVSDRGDETSPAMPEEETARTVKLQTHGADFGGN